MGSDTVFRFQALSTFLWYIIGILQVEQGSLESLMEHETVT